MANQPGSQQPYQANPTPLPPTPQPAAHASPTPPPQLETQAQPLSPPQSKPPSPPRSPSTLQTEIPIRRIRAQPPLLSPSPSSSPSWRSSQKQTAEQTPLQQQPSPSTRRSLEPSPTPTRSRTPSPTQEASEPRQEVATQEVSRAPSLSSPSVLQPDSPAKKPLEPQPQESQPTVEALSQTTVQPQPEPSTRPQAQEQSPSEPAEAGNQPTENLEPKTAFVDIDLSTTSQTHLSQREPNKIKEENSTTNQELKQELPLVEESRQIGIESKEDKERSELSPVEEKPQKDEELKQNIQTLRQPQVEGKPKKNVEPRSSKSENKNDDPKTKPEVQLTKKSTLSSDESKNTTEIMSSIAEPDSQATRLHLATSELITKLRSSGQQANLNGSNGRENTIGPRPRSIPLASPSLGERASFHKEIKDGISKLVQNLNLEQLQQLGSENPIRIITLTGENKGTTMFIGHETATTEGVLYTHRGHRLDNNKAEASSGNKEIQKQLLNHTGTKNPAITTSNNSNVQYINNSLLHESSCSGGKPGIHLVLSIKPCKPVKLKENAESIETLSAMSNSQTRLLIKHQEASKRTSHGI